MSRSKKHVKQYFKLSHELVASERYNCLSHPAIIILNYSMIFYHDNNPEHPFTLPYSEIKSKLHIGGTATVKAIKQLIKNRYWISVRKGGRNRPATYRHNPLLLSVYVEDTTPIQE